MKIFFKVTQWTTLISIMGIAYAGQELGYWDENDFWVEVEDSSNKEELITDAPIKWNEETIPAKKETKTPTESDVTPLQETPSMAIAPPSKEEECCEEPEICCYDFICSNLEIGGNYTYVNFKQGELGSVHGHLGGAQILYETTICDDIYSGLKFLWRQGCLDNDRFFLDIDTQVRLGYSFFDCCDDYILTLFTGFGWRYMSSEFKSTCTLHFNHNEVYIPVGFLTCYCINSCFRIGFYGTWMPQVFTNVNIVPNDNARWVLENRLDIFRIEVPLMFDISCLCGYDISFILKPFYEFWRDGKSKAKTSTGIPLGLLSNRYHFTGFEFNIGYSF